MVFAESLTNITHIAVTESGVNNFLLAGGVGDNTTGVLQKVTNSTTFAAYHAIAPPQGVTTLLIKVNTGEKNENNELYSRLYTNIYAYDFIISNRQPAR